MLSFNGKGHTQSILLEVDMSDEGKVDQKQVALKLKKDLKKY